MARLDWLVSWWWLGVAGLAVALFGRRKNWLATLLVLSLGLSLGLYRGHSFMIKLQPYNQWYGRNVVVRGQASSDGVYGPQSQLVFDITNLSLEQPVAQPLIGRVAVGGLGEKAVYRGDLVRISGRLYPARGGRQGRLQFARVVVLQRNNGWLDQLRRRFAAGMLSALPEPHGSFGLGLLIGQRSTLPKLTADQLSAVGLTHLLAVSGYNLTIIIRALRRGLAKRSKYQTLVGSLLLMVVFCLISGLSASLVRAALVSGLSLGAWYYGREFKPLVLLFLVAALTAAWSPLYVWADVGWYLSFLAFYGVMVLAPAIGRRRRTGLLGQLLVETMAAQLLTLPLIMYLFGQFSLIGLLANLLVIPLVPLTMLLALLAGLAGWWLGPLAGWLAWPARWSLTYMLDVVTALARLPHGLLHHTISLGEMLIAYGLIGLFSWVLVSAKPVKSGIITE